MTPRRDSIISSAGKNVIAYRPKDAAAALGISRSTIYEMIADGKIQARKIGSATVIGRDELDRIFQESELSAPTKRAQASIR